MNNLLQYKGYTATVEYSAEDKVFCGKIAMINDLVTFEADNVADLESEFKLAVDDYLITCQQVGKNPEKTFRGIFNVRISPKLHKSLYREALAEDISLNKLVAKKLAIA